MELDLGNVMGPQGPRGSLIYYGTAITGTSTSGTIFSGSGIASAMVDDKYLNTSTGDFYTCTTAGAPSVARWAWIVNLRGPQGNVGPAGPTGQIDENTPITFSTPSTYSAPASGNTIAVLFGKITKGLSDLFTSVAAKLDSSKVLESRNITQEGYAMGGKTACEWMTELSSKFSLHYYEDVTTDEYGSWNISVPSGYITIAGRPYNYQYGIFVSNFGIRAYEIANGNPQVARNTNIGSVQILFMKQ